MTDGSITPVALPEEKDEAIRRYEAGRLTIKELCIILEVSKSQAYKILQRYKAEGILGLYHKSRNKPSNNRTGETKKEH